MEIATTIVVGYRYVVWSNSITYNGVTYDIGDEFYGIAGVTTYTGSGYASEIVELNSTAQEIITEPGNIIFPEQLHLKEVALEVTPPVNGTIFPEMLRIYSTALEVGSEMKEDVKIIDY